MSTLIRVKTDPYVVKGQHAQGQHWLMHAQAQAQHWFMHAQAQLQRKLYSKFSIDIDRQPMSRRIHVNLCHVSPYRVRSDPCCPV